MKEGTVLSVTSKQPNRKKITETITYANPNATEQQLTEFVVGMNDLSKNKLLDIQRVQADNIFVAPNEEDDDDF